MIWGSRNPRETLPKKHVFDVNPWVFWPAWFADSAGLKQEQREMGGTGMSESFVVDSLPIFTWNLMARHF